MNDANTFFGLTKKTIVVTGASSGIGRQCAITCSTLGARVILIGRNLKRLEETLDLMDAKHEHQLYQLNLLNYNVLDEVLDEVGLKFTGIDGIINCAGISATLPFRRVTPEKMEMYFQSNVIMSFNLSRLIIQKKLMPANGGSIVFISSVMGIVGESGKTLYSMTKGALIAGAKSLAIELARKNIRVNCVSPGVVTSPMSEKAIYNRDAESINNMEKQHPLGIGDVNHIANACAFLLSDAAKWITGTNLVVDGGYTAK